MLAAASNDIRGMAAAVAAAAAFSLNDMAIKLMSGDYPLHEIVLIRSTIGLILTVAIFAQLEGGLKLRTKWPLQHAFRAAMLVTANVTFFSGLAALPLADATAIFFVAPLMITALSVVVLGEHVGPRRWIAVAVGLVGVIAIVRPTSASFQIAAILPIVAALCYAATHMMTRHMRGRDSAATMSIYVQLGFILFSTSFGLVAGDGRFATSEHPSLQFIFAEWSIPSAFDFGIMAMAGAASATGGYLITVAYREAEAALVAPFEYLALVMAIIWGFLIFGEVPVPVAAFGMALVLGSGLFIAVREAQLGKRRGAPKR